jgi:thiol-disulfide isomerase/thioredoxin
MEDDLQTKGSALIRLTDTKEVRKLLTSAGPILVVVYAKWCGHCRSMFDTWRELSNVVKGNAKVYVIESTDYTDEDISGYPSMRLVKNGISKEYSGERDTKSMSDALLAKNFGGRRARRRLTRRLRRTTRKTK